MAKKPKKYDPQYKEFMVPFTYLILGAGAIIVSVNMYNRIIQAGLLIIGVIFAIWGTARILRIFLKIFLDQMKGW